jgi:hypothetical protein
VQGCTVRLIEPVTGVERQQLDFSAVWQTGRLVNDETASSHLTFDGHMARVALGEPPHKRLQPPAAGAIMRPPQLKRLRSVDTNQGDGQWP